MSEEQGTGRPEGRVITGEGQNIFKTTSGGRSDYGGLIISALTGKSQEELLTELSKRDGDAAKKLRKELAQGGEVMATLMDAEDQFFEDYLRISGGPSLLAPPIAPERLERLVSENNALEPCIAAMTTNVSCTGAEIMPVEGSEAELTDEEKTQRKHLREFFEEVAPRKSFLRVRKELRRDLHTTGNSYMVIERTITKELAFVRRAPAKSMRMIKLDKAVPVTVTVRRNGELRDMTTTRAERRYVQKVGTKMVYYKEYGSERDLDRVTGEWARPGQTLAPNQRAHEIIHDKDIDDVRSPYGMPRWITQLPSVLGSRMAEEHNLAFFQAGGVPPVMVFITGGLVSEAVAKSVNGYLSGGSKDKQRGVAVEIPSSGDINNERPASVTVEKFGANDADSTFENYDERNEMRVRRAFRLPGIFLGMSDNYNFATAHASYVVAEAQVFGPERMEEDERINMTIMREIDPTGQWRLVSNPMSVQDVNLQLRALQMLGETKGVGLADFVGGVSQVAGLEIEVHEDHEEDVIGVSGVPAPGDGNPPPPPPAAGATEDGQEAGNGDTPPPPTGEGEPPSPGVTSTVRNQAVVLASRIARSIRDYEDTQEESYIADLLALEALYDELPESGRELVNKALGPVVFNSPFLSDAAMGEVAAGYAKAAFHAARAQSKLETVQ